MKRKASNLIILLVLIAGIVGVILYARGKQLAPSYGPSESSGTKMDSSDLPSGSAGLVLSELMVEKTMQRTRLFNGKGEKDRNTFRRD